MLRPWINPFITEYLVFLLPIYPYLYRQYDIGHWIRDIGLMLDYVMISRIVLIIKYNGRNNEDNFSTIYHSNLDAGLFKHF